jgi:TonB family protein
MRRRFWILLLSFTIPPISMASVSVKTTLTRTATLDKHERSLGITLGRQSEFSDVPHVSARWRCEEVQLPQALTTPDPLLAQALDRMKIRISFIIGTDGRVHSPLVLESAGPTGDRRILQTVRTWRYRPATCNGVPTETEEKVEFSSR